MTISSNRTALITGASRGLGLALARQLAQQHWTLILDARGTEALEEAQAELVRHTRVIALAGDINDKAHRQALAKQQGMSTDSMSWSITQAC